MFSRIVVGTDGSETATEAVRAGGGPGCEAAPRSTLVSAYEPGSQTRLREERQQVPDDMAAHRQPP